MVGKILVGLTVLFVSLIFDATSVKAVTPSPYSDFPVEQSSVFITAVQVNGTLDYVEIYNSDSVPIYLGGWKVTFSIYDGDATIGPCEIVLGEWLRPSGYGLVAERSIIEGDDDNFLPFDLAGCDLATSVDAHVSEINLIEGGVIRDQLLMGEDHDNESWVRRNSTTNCGSALRRENNFVRDFERAADWMNCRDQLYTGGWYGGPPAGTNGLQILEILANSNKCSPVDSDLTCGNYIKLYNQTDSEINLADYRLRTGHQGQSPGINNRFTWGQDIMPELEEYILLPGEYFMLTTRNDGQPISVTTTGGFIWLEDAYGVKIYESTIVEYPSASSTTKVGWAWAFDGKTWQWTMSPQPYGPNVFELPPPKPAAAGRSLVPCRPGQERNPETNRCRSTASAGSTLTPCRPGQERNPDTNRCRSVAGSSSSAAA
jgi:hypothetical protein